MGFLSSVLEDNLSVASARRLLSDHCNLLCALLQETRDCYRQDRESGLFELTQSEIELPLEWHSYPARLSGTWEIGGRRVELVYELDRIENRYAYYTVNEV